MAGLKRVKSLIRFQRECCRAAAKTGYEVSFYPAKANERSINEDDGSLHITKFGVRACFWIQHDEPKIQNARAREVLDALRLKTPVTALVDESECDDECPHCGRSL